MILHYGCELIAFPYGLFAAACNSRNGEQKSDEYVVYIPVHDYCPVDYLLYNSEKTFLLYNIAILIILSR